MGEPGGSRGSAGWKQDQKKKLIDTSVECYHLAIQNLCTSSSLTWAYIPGSQHPWARWVEGVSRVEEGPKKKTQSIPRWNATIWQPKISVPALPPPGPTYHVASIHEPAGSRGSAGWKKDQKEKRSRCLGEMLPFGNPKSLYQLFSHLGLHTR